MEKLSPALRLTAHFTTEYDRHAGLPMSYEFGAELPSVETAKEFAAQFPKAAKMIAMMLSKSDGTVAGWATTRGSLVADGVNGGLNETGLKRYQTIIRTAAKLGIQIEYVANAKNSYPTREAYEATIA